MEPSNAEFAQFVTKAGVMSVEALMAMGRKASTASDASCAGTLGMYSVGMGVAKVHSPCSSFKHATLP